MVWSFLNFCAKHAKSCGKLLISGEPARKKGRPLTDFSFYLSRRPYIGRHSQALEHTKNNLLFFLEPAAQLQLGRPCLGSLRWASLPPLFAHFAARCHFNCAWVAGERVGRAAPAAMMVESLHLVSLNAKVKHWPARPEPWLPVKNA